MTTGARPVDRQRRGRLGEDAAVDYLTRAGYTVVARNVRRGRTELDVIAQEGGAVAFVEIKARWSDAYGAPEEAITATKRAHLIAAAERYLREHGLEGEPWRIDVLSLRLSGTRVVRYELFRDAIEDI